MLDNSKGKGFCTNGNAWSFIAKTDGGKYYYFKQYGTQQDADLYKHLYEISEEQYNISAAECFLTLSRKDGQSFELPTTTTLHTSDSDITGVPAGKTFTEIRFLHSQAYSYLLVNGDPTRATGTDGVIWSLNLTKDWVIEDTPGFGSSLFTLRSVHIHYLCEFEGNGHKLYRVDNNTETPLIMIEKPINLPAGYSDDYVKFKNITIDGSLNGEGQVKTQQGIMLLNSKVLFDSNVIVENCKYDNPTNHGGGGVYVRENSELTINPGNIIRNCESYSAFGGGAIYMRDYSILNVNGAEISGNTTGRPGDASRGYGGAISCTGANSKINITNSTLSNNSSTDFGGAVYARCPLDIADSKIISNSSENGGGIYARGNTNIVNTLVDNNFASYEGGGIYLRSTANMNNVTVSNNTTLQEGRTSNNFGGGVYIDNNAVVTATNSTIKDNTSMYGGGINVSNATLNIDGSSVQRNASSKLGGGIYMDTNAVVNIANNSTVANNESPFGGGVMAFGGTLNITGSSTLEGNKSNRGGGIMMSGGTLKVDNSTLKENSSNSFGGGIYIYNGVTAAVTNNSKIENNKSFFGGGIAVDGGSLTVNNSTLEGNIAGVAPEDPDTGQGGGILLMGANDVLNMKGSLVKSNSARYGAGVYLRAGSGEFSGVEFNGNDTGQGDELSPAGRHGGGLYVQKEASAEIKDSSKFIANTANWGGAIYTSQHSTENPIPLNTPIAPTDPYQNLQIDSSTYFQGNVGVNGLFLPPDNFADFTNLGFTADSDVAHELTRTSLLNNYDVYYRGVEKTVTYLANGGKFSDGSDTKTEERFAGENIKLIAPPKRNGFVFVGWKEGDKIYKAGDSFLVTGDHTFEAQWKEDKVSVVEKTITYSANGGKFSDGTDTKTEKHSPGETIQLIDPPKRDGFVFIGWKEGDKIYNAGDSFLVIGNHNFEAQWEEEIQPQPEPIYHPTVSLKWYVQKKDKTESHIAYIEGYEDGKVKAAGNLTRAEAAAMVSRLENLNLYDRSKPDYPDAEENAWYLPYLNAALKQDMLDADERGNIRPNDKITRAEFANMLAQIDKNNDYVSNFTDISGHKYESQINKICGNKRIIGYEDGSFRPNNLLTRAEAATILNRMYNRVADEISIANLKTQVKNFPDMDKSDWFYWEIVEASNSHDFTRRIGKDKFDRDLELWERILYNSHADKNI